MPISYRCRCGQEVVLRPREGTYALFGLVLVLTLVNTVLTASLWLSREDVPAVKQSLGDPSDDFNEAEGSTLPKEPRPEAVASAGGDGDSEDDPGRLASNSGRPGISDPASIESSPTPLIDSDPFVRPSAVSSSLAPESLTGAQPAAEITAAETTAAETTAAETTAAETTAAEVTAAVVPPWVSSRPPGADGLALWVALQNLPDDPIDRVAVLISAVTWGKGFIRSRAEEILNAEDSEFGEWLRTWAAGQGVGANATVTLPADRAPSGLLDGLSRRFSSVWSPLPSSVPKSARDWVEQTRSALDGRTDFVVLVDLTESMEADVFSTIRSLRTITPLLDAEDAGYRWGWIGFRDEVVARFDLTADVEAFLASMQAWHCESGGDVPEGVDRAIFEALKFGSLNWNPGARRSLLLIGDAPPPYERISSAVSLMGQAHKSPEGYTLSALGILREEEFDEVVAFRSLVEAGGGRVEFVREAVDPIDVWWGLIVGPRGPAWGQAVVR